MTKNEEYPNGARFINNEMLSKKLLQESKDKKRGCKRLIREKRGF